MAFVKCKYCGKNNITFQETSFSCVKRYYCMCNNCLNKTEEYLSKESAFKAWNKENKGK